MGAPEPLRYHSQHTQQLETGRIQILAIQAASTSIKRIVMTAGPSDHHIERSRPVNLGERGGSDLFVIEQPGWAKFLFLMRISRSDGYTGSVNRVRIKNN